MKTFVTILFALLAGCLSAVLPTVPGPEADNASIHECNSNVTGVQQFITSASIHSEGILSNAGTCNGTETSLRSKGGRSHTPKEHHTGCKGKPGFHPATFPRIAKSLCRYTAHFPNSVEKYILALERLII